MHATVRKVPEIVPPARYPSGEQKPDKPKELFEEFPPTLIRRIKDQIVPLGRHKHAGTTLFDMHMRGILTEIEVEAGFRYAADVGAYEHMKGHPRRHSQSPSFEFGRKGAEGLDLDALRRMDPDTADKVERRIKRRRKTIQKRYDRVQMFIPHFPILISTLIEEVCCNDRPVHSAHHPMVKKILRTLAENCYPDLVQHEGRRRQLSRKIDAVLVASAAITAMADWFSRRAWTVTGFRLATKVHAQQPLGITGYGHTAWGEVVEHTIRLRRSGLMAEQINAQLLKSALAKGWSEARAEQGA